MKNIKELFAFPLLFGTSNCHCILSPLIFTIFRNGFNDDFEILINFWFIPVKKKNIKMFHSCLCCFINTNIWYDNLRTYYRPASTQNFILSVRYKVSITLKYQLLNNVWWQLWQSRSHIWKQIALTCIKVLIIWFLKLAIKYSF